jgi:hypothetical protein
MQELPNNIVFNFEVTKAEAESILTGLAARPYGEVHALMAKLQTQVHKQVADLAALQAALAAPPVDSPEVKPPAA